MSMKLKKAVNDLLLKPGRTILVIVALVIGLWGVGSILVSYTILTNDLRENYVRTNPAHAILTSADFNRQNMESLQTRTDIESAEFRGLSFQRIEVKPDVWIPLWLFGVEDFSNIRLARMYSHAGKNIPDAGSILIERDGLLISNLGVGKQARIRAGSKVSEIPVTGIAFDPAQAPATQDNFIYGYVDAQTYAVLTGGNIERRLPSSPQTSPP